MGDFPLGHETFSIVLPVASNPINTRKVGFIGAVDSVFRQSYTDWELILVDDGCTDDIPQLIDEYAKKDTRIKAIHQQQKQRTGARNAGMKAATKDWICWLDSDDEYLKTYLEVLNSYMTEDYPGYKCYHFGAIVVRMGYQSLRQTQELKEENNHMEFFRSGGTGAGSFVFHKSILADVGFLPECLNPYRFADLCKEESPELIQHYGPKYLEGGKELGNPWGDDWYMFYKITRKYKSKGLPIAPYIQYVRRQRFSFQPAKDY